MSEPTQNNWLAKLAAWTHDPAEKALVLLRDPAGHEGGTVHELKQALFPNGIGSLATHVKRADHWASAADRPQFPRDAKDGRYAAWTQVRFTEAPVLIHPLSGTAYPLGKLDIDPAHQNAVAAMGRPPAGCSIRPSLPDAILEIQSIASWSHEARQVFRIASGLRMVFTASSRPSRRTIRNRYPSCFRV